MRVSTLQEARPNSYCLSLGNSTADPRQSTHDTVSMMMIGLRRYYRGGVRDGSLREYMGHLCYKWFNSANREDERRGRRGPDGARWSPPTIRRARAIAWAPCAMDLSIDSTCDATYTCQPTCRQRRQLRHRWMVRACPVYLPGPRHHSDC